MTIKAGDINKGMCVLIKDTPHLVVEREFVNPGKGSAFVRLKLKNLRTGQVLKEVRKSPDNVDVADVEEKNAQYMYADAQNYHFMDNATYEQFEVNREGFDDKINFMKEGDTFKLITYENSVLDIILPYKIVYQVTDAQEGVKGDTVTGATKIVTLETGLQVRVPIFIKQGEYVMINTETKDYVERVNK